MRTAEELKDIFQEGWNILARVENYARGATEFTEGETHVAWRETLAEAVGSAPPLDVLDVGTGPGLFACLYAQMGHRATGLDFSERMLSVAKQRASELELDCKFIFADAEAPPFDDNAFEVVSSRHVLFNLPRPGVAVREWVRVLKPGGRLILMGNDHDEQPRMRSLVRSRRLGQKKEKRGWSAAPGYREAVAECPLFRHGSRTLRAVMEAVGLEEIHLHPADAIQAARQHSSSRRSKRFVAAGKFFILVGVKP